MEKILFVDRDGTLIEEPEDRQVDAIDKIRLVPGVIPALLTLRDRGYRLVIVSNQDGLGTESFPQADYERCQQYMLALFSSQGIEFDAVFVCPHREADNCDCRKPRAGLLTRFLAERSIDLSASAVVGDRTTDVELAERLGVRGFRINGGSEARDGWPEVVSGLSANRRYAREFRKTRETEIEISADLDETAPLEIDTGIGFFDHMLEQLAKHGGFSLRLRCRGDLQVDEHHTVEDTAICLGKALRQALGDKLGIARYGFLLPMDESEARVALDLSGRPAFRFDGALPRERVGELATELVPHFFRSLSESLGAALHIEVRGENAHHMIEACFKSVGRSLRQAIRREDNSLPSTKGVLD